MYKKLGAARVDSPGRASPTTLSPQAERGFLFLENPE